jgi:sulfur carrier protein ThiS
MKVNVRLYGTLSREYPGYRHSQGIEVELPDGATVNDLLVHLGISESQKAVVAIDGRIQKANDKMPSGACAQVFQPVHGG